MRTVMIIGGGCSFGCELATELSKYYDRLIFTENIGRFLALGEAKKACRTGTQVLEYVLDVTDINSISHIFTELDKIECKLDSLIYCVGINTLQNVLEITPEVWDMVLDINLKGFFFCAKQAISNMIRNDIRGSIVAVASQHSVVVSRNRAPYCASKSGLVQVAKEMALEFALSGIVINTVSPTFIESDLNREFLRSASAKRDYLSKIPIGRYASAEDVVRAIMFLSCDNKFITGHNLLVDGGYSIC